MKHWRATFLNRMLLALAAAVVLGASARGATRTNQSFTLGWPRSECPFVSGTELGWWPQAGGDCTTVDCGTNISCVLTTSPCAVVVGARYYVQSPDGWRSYSWWSPMMHYPGDDVIDVTGIGLEATDSLDPPIWWMGIMASTLSVTNPTGSGFFRSLDLDGATISRRNFYGY